MEGGRGNLKHVFTTAKMTDLNVANPFPASSPQHLAYRRAYDLSKASLRTADKALRGRVLGYMLQELPTINGRLKVASEVNSCVDEQSLVELGTFYITYFLGTCE
jgi:hypothetical protein